MQGSLTENRRQFLPLFVEAVDPGAEDSQMTHTPSKKGYYEPARWYDLRDFSPLRDVEFFKKMAKEHGPRILECAVGTGRIAIPLAREGFDVWGIDRDKDMLERARQKWEKEKRAAKGSLRLAQTDVTDFNLRKRFDMAFIAFNTFLTLATVEQSLAVLRCVRRHLVSGGRFIIDTYQPSVNAYAGDQPEHRDFFLEDPETGCQVERYSWDRRDMSIQKIQTTFEYRWTEPGGRRGREIISFPLRVIFPVEMRLLLQMTGYEVERIYGDHDGSAFQKRSPRMIFVARKSPRRGARRSAGSEG